MFSVRVGVGGFSSPHTCARQPRFWGVNADCVVCDAIAVVGSFHDLGKGGRKKILPVWKKVVSLQSDLWGEMWVENEIIS
jgi:hypothetical protein